MHLLYVFLDSCIWRWNDAPSQVNVAVNSQSLVGIVCVDTNVTLSQTNTQLVDVKYMHFFMFSTSKLLFFRNSIINKNHKSPIVCAPVVYKECNFITTSTVAFSCKLIARKG